MNTLVRQFTDDSQLRRRAAVTARTGARVRHDVATREAWGSLSDDEQRHLQHEFKLTNDALAAI